MAQCISYCLVGAALLGSMIMSMLATKKSKNFRISPCIFWTTISGCSSPYKFLSKAGYSLEMESIGKPLTITLLCKYLASNFPIREDALFAL